MYTRMIENLLFYLILGELHIFIYIYNLINILRTKQISLYYTNVQNVMHDNYYNYIII